MKITQKRISMQDIADKLQISKNAVSLALNDKPGVSKETREQVINLARQLNYNNMGGSPASSTDSKNILVCIPNYIRNDIYFYNDIYWSIDHRASQKGYTAVLATITDEMQNQNLLPPICMEMQFTGILIVGVLNNSYVRFLLQQIPVAVAVDHMYYGIKIKSIVTSNIEASYTLTREVIAHNHTKIGYVGSYGMTASLFERWCGFKKAMQDTGLPVKQEYCISEDSPLSSLFSDPSEILQILKRMKELPTAFVCGGDRIAIAVISALKTMGYEVPDRISVVGFDDIELGGYIEPPLTTMHVKRNEMGRLAVDLLLCEKDGHFSPDTYALNADYVKRSSLTWAPASSAQTYQN